MTAVVVCGTPYSGTSLVAGTLQRLGVDMGKNLDDTYQDSVFAGCEGMSDKLLAEITQRNRQELWGFKTVTMHRFLAEAFYYLRDPVIVLCSRGLGSTLAKSKSKYRKGRQDLTDVLREHAFLVEFLSDKDCPLHIVDFGTDPVKLVSGLVDFIGLTVPYEAKREAILFNNPEKGYQT